MLIKLENGKPVGFPLVDANFRAAFPNTSFPLYLTKEDVEPLGYGLYDFSSPPETGRYEKAIEVSPVRDEFGIWRQSYEIVAMTEEEKAEADKQEANIQRLERNGRLFASDWTQLADSPVDGTTWLAYRQQLREVPSQPGFPWDIVWPEKPA